MRYRVSRAAQQDLDQIFFYWAKRASLEAADGIISSITERFLLLSEHTDAGRAADDIVPGVKCFPAGKYLIYYRKEQRNIDILHVFTGLESRGLQGDRHTKTDTRQIEFPQSLRDPSGGKVLWAGLRMNAMCPLPLPQVG
jgi:toxin ParE1/3/4